MPNLSKLYFKTALLFLIVGICMGLQMAITHNHDVTGAHAHANLLGWVTMALFGTYYSLSPELADLRIAKIQYAIYTTGVVLMVPALYLMLKGYSMLEPLVAISSLITFAGVLLFAYIVFRRDILIQKLSAQANATTS